jgi:hypothetical protein
MKTIRVINIGGFGLTKKDAISDLNTQIADTIQDEINKGITPVKSETIYGKIFLYHDDYDFCVEYRTTAEIVIYYEG